MVRLEHVLARDLLVGLEQVLDHARRVAGDLVGRLADVELAHAQDVDHQHRVVSDHRPSRFGDDGRVVDAGGVADLEQREHDVVRVLLRRVVHRRREVGLRAVVVDAQPAARVEVLERRAQLADLDVEAPRLAQRVLDRADGGDLAAQVKVQQLETSEQVVRAQKIDRLDDLARRQAELGPVAARRLPAPRALGRQLDADADARAHPDLLGGLGDQRQLGELLDDDQHRASQLRRHQRGLDVLLVLVAVADDQRVLVVEHGHDGQQLGLGAGLQAVVVGAPELADLLDHVAVLVDLDRVDALELALVAVLGDGGLERLVQLDDPALEHVGEPDQQRQTDSAAGDLVDQLLEIDRRAVGARRMRDRITRLGDRKIVMAPVFGAIDLGGVRDRPLTRNADSSAHVPLLVKKISPRR